MPTTEIVKASDFRALNPDNKTLEIIKHNLEGEEITEFDLARVKMPSGGATSWEYPILGGTEPRKEIPGVVVYSKFTRSYWEQEFKGGNIPPDCSSPDATLATPREGFKPPAKQEGNYFVCDTCANQEWGSSQTGSKKGQACKKMRPLFLLTAERMLPLVIVLPPSSLQAAKKFFLELIDYGVDQESIIVNIGLEKIDNGTVPAYSQAVFTAGETLTDDQVAFVREYAATMRPHFERVQLDVFEEASTGAE